MGSKRYQWLWAGMILLSLGACANVSLSSEEWATLNVALRESYLREKEQQFGVLMNAYVDAASFTEARMNTVTGPIKMMLDRAESFEAQRPPSGMEVSAADFKHVLAYVRASHDTLYQMYIELVSKEETLLSPFVAKRLLAEAVKESAAWRKQLADLDKQAVSTIELKYHVLDQLFLASQFYFIRRFIPLGTRSPCGVNTYFPIVKESSSKIYQAGDTVKLELGVAQQLYDLDAARVYFVVGGDTVKMDNGSKGYYEQVLTHKDRQTVPIDLLIVNGLTGECMRTSLDYQLQGQ